MRDYVAYIFQSLWYGLLRQRPNIDFSVFPSSFNFTSHYDKKNDTYWIEASDMPEFYVSAKSPAELAKNIQETMMVYYDIPRYFAKRISMSTTYDFSNPKTGESQSFNYKFKEEVARQTA